MLIKRLEVLYASLDDFLMTLKLAKPRNLSEFINLSQVMTIYDYLLESPSVGKNVHTDLVKEFVDIVAALKSILIQQSQDMSLLTKDLVMFVHVEELLMAKELREDVLGMCEECYEFPSSWNLTKVKLSPMDDPIFRRLVAFLPETMKRLDKTVNTILRIRKLVKLHN
ncbi:hypothetical protein CAPTEDRAFT_203131 [Capitella teleta]|uniref:Uncharacterized protein n=1 Tax=Capitella teleta TaxID=283909 RepID=R7UAZ8_CAPTE|nr:hypothetical protein CAPTEDRAFT_203131 [Capitella teleta]|eukprot:ELU00963.1 hypothetical protein CAPTEDRAFT_203131 [Capitella teleta]